MDGLVAYAWQYLASRYYGDTRKLLKKEEKNQAACQTGCCGLPVDEGRRKLHEKAVYALNQAIAWGASTLDLYHSLYWHYHHLGQFEEGAEACRKALELDRDSAYAAHGLGICLKSLGRADEAIAPLEHAVALDLESPDALELLIACHEQLGRGDDAARLAGEGLERFPDHIPFMRSLYNQLEREDRHDEAKTLTELAAALNPEDYAPQVALGHIYRKLGQHTEAIGAFREGLRLAPGNSSALGPLIDALESAGRAGEIPDLLEEQANFVIDAVNGSTLGEKLYQYGRFESAIRVLSRVTLLLPQLVDPHVWLARSHRALDRDDEAQQVLTAAVAHALDSIKRLDDMLPELRTLDERPNQPDLRLADTFEAYTYKSALEAFLEAGALEEARAHLPRLECLDEEEARAFSESIRALEATAERSD